MNPARRRVMSLSVWIAFVRSFWITQKTWTNKQASCLICPFRSMFWLHRVPFALCPKTIFDRRRSRPCMDMLIAVTALTCSIITNNHALLSTNSAPFLDLNNELFGAVAEEKDIKGTFPKWWRPRHSKSSDSYELSRPVLRSGARHSPHPATQEVNNQCAGFYKRLTISQETNLVFLFLDTWEHSQSEGVEASACCAQEDCGGSFCSIGAWALSPSYCSAMDSSMRVCRSLPAKTSTSNTLTQGCIRNWLIRSNLNNFTSHIHPERSSVYLQILVCPPPSCLLLPATPKRGGARAPSAAEQTCTSWWKRVSCKKITQWFWLTAGE